MHEMLSDSSRPWKSHLKDDVQNTPNERNFLGEEECKRHRRVDVTACKNSSSQGGIAMHVSAQYYGCVPEKGAVK